MSLQYSPKNNPRVIIIQKLYGKFFNNEEILIYPKHRFKKFIKDVVNGTVERDEVINEEMTSVANSDQHSFSIPLTVDINIGDNWGALH